MKPIILILIGLILFDCNSSAQIKTTETKTPLQFNVTEIAFFKWNGQEGIPYIQVPGANLGTTSFEIIDEVSTAFLCDATSEIIIQSNKGIPQYRFPVLFSPKDFLYENDMFFVLGEKEVDVYSSKGLERNKILFPMEFFGRANRIVRFNNSTYLLLASGNSLKIEEGGKAINSQEFEGWITNDGTIIITKVMGDNSYSVKVIKSNGVFLNKVFFTDKKTAGVFVIGSNENRIYLDVQKFLSESPITIGRDIVSIGYNENKFDTIPCTIRMPDMYYVLSNKEIILNKYGNILNMITAPDGVHVFSLIETKSKTVDNYPEALITQKYHFNNHLLHVE